MCLPYVMALHPIVVRIFYREQKNVHLRAARHEESGDEKSRLVSLKNTTVCATFHGFTSSCFEIFQPGPKL